MFTSSTGVYYPYLTTGIDETVEPRLVDDPETGEASSYGVQKALSEREAFPDGAIIVRPHYIVGPHDPKDRLTYWAVRIDRGGEALAPGHPNDAVQLIDVRDLTEWMIRMIEDGNTGFYNATGPLSRLSTAEMVYGIRRSRPAPSASPGWRPAFCSRAGSATWFPGWHPGTKRSACRPSTAARRWPTASRIGPWR